MNGSTTIASTQTSGSSKMLTAMVGIGVLCALLIVVTYESTRSRIAFLREEVLKQAIFKVLPGTVNTKTFQLNAEGTIEIFSEGSEAEALVYAGYDSSDELIGVAIEAAGQGYADVIRVLYGYNLTNQQIIGVHVLETKETPGLGDKIEKDENFLANFKALDASLSTDGTLIHSIETVKSGTKANPWEIDGITGATISSRAIGDMLNSSAHKWLPMIKKQAEVFEN